jgi:hypothetical protein
LAVLLSVLCLTALCGAGLYALAADNQVTVYLADIPRESDAQAGNANWGHGKLTFLNGWTYGAERNDEKKTHPCLIPYGDLPESEREYDRNTAFATLKLIIALGYKIEKA